MISANPATFSEGGNFLDDFDGKVLEAGTLLFDYNGKLAEGVPAVRLVIGHGENFAEIHIEHYTGGDVKNFMPSSGDGETFQSTYGAPEPGEDGVQPTLTLGRGFDQVGDKGVLNKNCKAGMLAAAFVNAGLDPTRLDTGDYTGAYTGAVCHWMRRNLPERTGGKALNAEKAGKKKYPEQILEPSEVKVQPGVKAAAKPAAAAAKKPVPATTAAKPTASAPAAVATAPAGEADTAAYDDKLQEIVIGKLSPEDGSVVVLKKQQLVPLVFDAIKTDTKFRAFAAKRVVNPDFLANGPWTFDAAANTVSLGG